MAKGKDTDIAPAVPAAPPAPAEPPVCSVCGRGDGDLSGSAGAAKWHPACEASHPHVIFKVKARA